MPCVETFPPSMPGVSAFALVTDSEVFLFDYDPQSVGALKRTIERYTSEGLITADEARLMLDHIA